MTTYQVTAFNRFTNKSKVRTVEAEDVLNARCSHAAVSNKMMANGWIVVQVKDSEGVVAYQGDTK